MALDSTNLKSIKLTGQPGEAYMLAGAAALRKRRGKLPANMPKGARLAHYEYRAAVFASLRSTDSFAWVFIAGEWRDVSRDLENFPLHEEAALLDAVTFASMFPALPALPRK